MAEQLDFAGNPHPVCTGCGSILNYGHERYDGDRCRPCRAEVEDEKDCDGCQATCLEGDVYPEYMYMSPFDDEESPTGFHYCQSCIDRGYDMEGMFSCEWCDRYNISDSSGHMMYYRVLDSEQVCLRCIEETLKEGGVAALGEEVLRKVTQEGHAFGMFFNVGELEAEGWVAHPDWNDTLYDASYCEDLANTTRALHEQGRAFIIGYERLSIVGDEGYITLYTHPAKVEPDTTADAADAYLRERARA